jgi:hypothetical protein
MHTLLFVQQYHDGSSPTRKLNLLLTPYCNLMYGVHVQSKKSDYNDGTELFHQQDVLGSQVTGILPRGLVTSLQDASTALCSIIIIKTWNSEFGVQQPVFSIIRKWKEEAPLERMILLSCL